MHVPNSRERSAHSRMRLTQEQPPEHRGYGYKVYRMRKDEIEDEKVDFLIVGRYHDHGFGRLRRNQLQQHHCNGFF